MTNSKEIADEISDNGPGRTNSDKIKIGTGRMLAELNIIDETGLVSHAEETGIVKGEWQPNYWDNLSSEPLIPELVQQARREEINETLKHNIWEPELKSKCIEVTGKDPIKVRWVDINKGDSDNPEYRSRIVAME